MSRLYGPVRLSLVVLVVSCLGLGLWETKGQDKDKEPAAKAKAPMEGAWNQASQIDAETGKSVTLPDGVKMTKIITGGRWNWTVVTEGRIVAAAGGTYTLKDDVFTENVMFIAGDTLKHLVGKSFAYPVKIEDGKWHLQGTFKLDEGDMVIDEIWERCE
jgi:hypothetical protein